MQFHKLPIYALKMSVILVAFAGTLALILVAIQAILYVPDLVVAALSLISFIVAAFLWNHHDQKSTNNQTMMSYATIAMLVSLIIFIGNFYFDIPDKDMPLEEEEYRQLVLEDQTHKCYYRGETPYRQHTPHAVYCYSKSDIIVWNGWDCWYRVLSTDDFGGNSAAMYYNCAK